MLPYLDYEQKILDLIRRYSITTTMGALQNQRLVLGGVRGSGGGEGGPIQPFIGKLTQDKVTFDTDEYATIAVPSGELASLLTNLNRIRAGVAIKPYYTPINYTVPSGLESTLLDHLDGIDSAILLGGGGSGHAIQHEGNDLPWEPYLNFVGAGVSVIDDFSNNATLVTISGGASGSGHTIQDEGSPLTQRTNLNFAGPNVVATDDSGNDATLVTISGQGWPYTNHLFTVDSLDADADYHTIADAFDAVASGTAILIGPESFTSPGILHDQPASVGAASLITERATLVGGNILLDTNTTLQSVSVTATAVTTNQVGVAANGDSAGIVLRDVNITVSGGSSTNYGVNLPTSGAAIHIYGGKISATGTGAYAINVGSGATVYLYGPVLSGTSGRINNSGTVKGWYYDSDGLLYHAADGNTYNGGLILSGITRTVGSGKNHATIQGAINWFAGTGKVLVGCYIDVDAGTYSEALSVSDIGSWVSTGLTIRGDQRLLSGRTYIDGAPANSPGTTNGGSGTVSLSNSGNDITVTMTTTNPSFSGDGWGSGDRLYVRHNSGVAIYNISSTSGNVITLTTTAPAIGNDGTAVCLMPNRIVQSSGNVVQVNRSNLTFTGFDFYQTTGGASGLQAFNGSVCAVNGCVVRGAFYGYFCSSVSYMACTEGSAWGNAVGFFSFSNAALFSTYGKAVSNTYGFYSQRFGTLETTTGVIGAGTTYGCYAEDHGYIYAVGVYARMNAAGTGFTAVTNGTMQASTTNARANCATNYSPTGTAPFTAEGSTFGVLIAT